jgi:hydroxyacylglutathione hydrolase
LAFNIPFLVHEKDIFLVKNLQKNASYWTKRKIIEQSPINIQDLASQGLPLRSWQAQVIETPGHTPGSVCFYFKEDEILFTGDTLFSDGVGRTDLSYSSPKDLQNSLKKLSQLPKKTKIYPGHGESSTLSLSLTLTL